MKVFVATPSYAGIPQPAYLDSLEATQRILRDRGDILQFHSVVGSRIIQTARNDSVFAFLESDADVLFFIDDDLAWEPQEFLRLVDSGFDVTCGAYPYRKKPEEWTIVLHTTPEGYPTGFKGWLDTANAPGGFLCIRRNVIERMRDENPALDYVDIQNGSVLKRHDYFPQGVKNGRWWGEDFAFSNVWTEMGGKIWCWPNMTFDHAGTKGNYHEFLMAQPKVSNAA